MPTHAVAAEARRQLGGAAGARPSSSTSSCDAHERADHARRPPSRRAARSGLERRRCAGSAASPRTGTARRSRRRRPGSGARRRGTPRAARRSPPSDDHRPTTRLIAPATVLRTFSTMPSAPAHGERGEQVEEDSSRHAPPSSEQDHARPSRTMFAIESGRMHLPAQVHDLVVAEARQRPAQQHLEPDHHHDLQQERVGRAASMHSAVAKPSPNTPDDAADDRLLSRATGPPSRRGTAS